MPLSRLSAPVKLTWNSVVSLRAPRSTYMRCSFESEEKQSLTAVDSGGTATLERPFSAWRDPDDPYELMVESFAESVIAGTPVALDPESSIANMRVLDRIRQAAGI